MSIALSGVKWTPTLTKSFKSAADYRLAVQFVAVKLTDDDTVIRASTGEAAIGVMMNLPNTGEQAEVIVSGSAPIKVGSAITIGQDVKIDSNGEAVPSTTDREYILGTALQAGADGDIIEILLTPGKQSSHA